MIAMLPRCAVIAVALVLWFWTQKIIGSRQQGNLGIGDAVHRLTAGWHTYFTHKPKSANGALIVSSLLIDVFGLLMIGFSVFGDSFAPFLAILFVFGLRQICQLCCTLPPPAGIIWRDPGFPSLLVTYRVSNDFFFSGHTALAVLGAIYACQIGPWWLGAAAVVVAVGEAVIVLVLRAHYTMDVLAGTLAAWLAADLSSRAAPWLNQWLMMG